MNSFFSIQFEITNEFKSKLCQWADRFQYFCFLDSNLAIDKFKNYDFIIGVDAVELYSDIGELSEGNFYFGHIGYKSQEEHWPLKAFVDFGNSLFFLPRYVIYAQNGRLYFNRNAPESLQIFDAIQNELLTVTKIPPIHFQARTSPSDYIDTIRKIQTSIRHGQFYELNYCIEFYNENANIQAVPTFQTINAVAQSPMSALLKYANCYALCFSPERLACLKDTLLTSQPIKGTARRNTAHPEKDEEVRKELAENIKERAENTMIVDLVRHDMTPYAKTGSIRVTELCKIYTFPFVHQMISTIEAELTDKKYAKQALRKLLPAGSMTGAPKKEVMKYIDGIENFQRGLYAGNIGYFHPNGDFDFNVVIRTLYYDHKNKKISLAVGGAITLLSDAEKEFHECLLKAEGILGFFHE